MARPVLLGNRCLTPAGLSDPGPVLPLGTPCSIGINERGYVVPNPSLGPLTMTVGLSPTRVEADELTTS